MKQAWRQLPWSARSGAHMNPAVTWTFGRLGKVTRGDALFYSLFQVAGEHRVLRRGGQVACAKWNHDRRQRCIFCGHPGIPPKKKYSLGALRE